MIILGHRGARFEAPENTVAGFDYARDLGLAAVEFDVRMTIDGELVVIHDATVDRTTNGSGRVAELTFDEVRALDARAGFPDWPQPCPIPTLDEVLDAVTDFAAMEIEVKRDRLGRAQVIITEVLEAMERHQRGAEVTITSFDTDVLRVVQHVAPEQPRGYIGAWDSHDFLDTATQLGATRAGIPHATGSAEMVRVAQEQGMTVTGWPCNSAEEFALFSSWGVEGICTDAPSVVLPLA